MPGVLLFISLFLFHTGRSKSSAKLHISSQDSSSQFYEAFSKSQEDSREDPQPPTQHLLTLQNNVWWHGPRYPNLPVGPMEQEFQSRKHLVETMCQEKISPRDCKLEEWQSLLRQDRTNFYNSIKADLRARFNQEKEQQQHKKKCTDFSSKLSALYKDTELQKYFLQPAFVAELVFDMITLEAQFLANLTAADADFKKLSTPGQNVVFKRTLELTTFIEVVADLCYCTSSICSLAGPSAVIPAWTLSGAGITLNALTLFITRKVANPGQDVAVMFQKLIALDVLASRIAESARILNEFAEHATVGAQGKFMEILRLKWAGSGMGRLGGGRNRGFRLRKQVKMLNINSAHAQSEQAEKIAARLKKEQNQSQLKTLFTTTMGMIVPTVMPKPYGAAFSFSYSVLYLIKAVKARSDIKKIISLSQTVLDEFHQAEIIIQKDEARWKHLLNSNPTQDEDTTAHEKVVQKYIAYPMQLCHIIG